MQDPTTRTRPEQRGVSWPASSGDGGFAQVYDERGLRRRGSDKLS